MLSKAELRKLLDVVIQQNAFDAREENLLLAMLVDHRESIWQLALQRILAARKHGSEKHSMQVFKVPKLNFEDERYIDLID